MTDKERIAELEAAIRKHRDQYGDDRCWENDIELYKVLRDNVQPTNICDPELMRANCDRYIACRMVKGEWASYLDVVIDARRLANVLNGLMTECGELDGPPLRAFLLHKAMHGKIDSYLSQDVLKEIAVKLREIYHE